MEQVDVLVIGGGVGALSCALYTSKAGLRTTVLNQGNSQLQSVDTVWNVPGLSEGIAGARWLESAREQVLKYGGFIQTAKVQSLTFENRPYSVLAEDGSQWGAKYVVLAVNLGYELLERHGFQLAVNEHVPSRKIRKVIGVGYDGRTQIPGVFVAGLLADVPSQTVIASGQGAFVGVQIATDHLERPFMWHD